MPQTAAPAHTRWVADLPLDVRLALAACEFAGVAIDEFSTGNHRPVFYEIKGDFLRCSTSLGAVMAMVNDAIDAECDRYRVAREHVSTIQRHIRTEVTSGSYYEGLNRLMHWVGITDEDED